MKRDNLVKKEASVGQAIKAVLAGFIGIRKSKHADAAQKLSPKVIILTALGCGLGLIILLVVLANVVIRQI